MKVLLHFGGPSGAQQQSLVQGLLGPPGLTKLVGRSGETRSELDDLAVPWVNGRIRIFLIGGRHWHELTQPANPP